MVWLAIRPPYDQVREFDHWIQFSMVFVGHSHLVLAFLAWRFARLLRNHPQRTSPGRSGWFALLFTGASSAVPAGVLFFPFGLGVAIGLVLATGLVFVPFSFWKIGRAAVDERRVLERFSSRAADAG
jgi:hypothetical protein